MPAGMLPLMKLLENQNRFCVTDKLSMHSGMSTLRLFVFIVNFSHFVELVSVQRKFKSVFRPFPMKLPSMRKNLSSLDFSREGIPLAKALDVMSKSNSFVALETDFWMELVRVQMQQQEIRKCLPQVARQAPFEFIKGQVEPLDCGDIKQRHQNPRFKVIMADAEVHQILKLSKGI